MEIPRRDIPSLYTQEKEGKQPTQGSPRMSVETFLTQLWDHPLLNEQTRNHRLAAIEYLQNISPELKQLEDSYAAFLVGSSVWITNEKSDYDFVIVAKDQESLIKIQKIILAKANNKVHIASADSIQNPDHPDVFINQNILPSVLFTPDEFVSGGLAQQLRVQAIQHIEKDLGGENWWENAQNGICANFKRYYADWPMQNFDKSRGIRLIKNLTARSEASENPDMYQKMFMATMKDFRPPYYQSYKDEILKNGGKLKSKRKGVL